MYAQKEKAPEKFILHMEEGGSISVGIEELYSNEVFDRNEEIFVPVSPGQLYHGNGIFSAFLNYAELNDLKIRLVNTGFLQRFTMQLILGSDDLDYVKEKTRKDVTENWDTRNLGGKNKETVERMIKKGLLEVTHWEDWVGLKPQFEVDSSVINRLEAEIKNAYEEENNVFRKAIDSAATAFFKGIHKEYKRKADYADLFEKIGEIGAKNLILKYLLEEAKIIFYWQYLGKKQMAYPFNQNSTSKKTIDGIRWLSQKWLKDDALKDLVPHAEMCFLNLEAKKEEPKNQAANRHRSGSSEEKDRKSPPSPKKPAMVSQREESPRVNVVALELEQKLRESEERERIAAERARLAELEKERLAAEKAQLAEEVGLDIFLAQSALSYKSASATVSERKQEVAMGFLGKAEEKAARLMGNAKPSQGLSVFTSVSGYAGLGPQKSAEPSASLQPNTSGGSSATSPAGSPPSDAPIAAVLEQQLHHQLRK